MGDCPAEGAKATVLRGVAVGAPVLKADTDADADADADVDGDSSEDEDEENRVG